MKKKIPTIIVILIVIAGLSFLLYPTLSDYLKSIAYNRAIESYHAVIADIDDETYDDLMAEAKAHNDILLARGNVRATLTDEEMAEYEGLLRIDESGIMGYVVIPKINVSLPIYHGTKDSVLQSGIGHLEGSSLPIGGEGTHSVLSGHRGLPSAKLFTNIDQLVVGDTFTVRVLREVLTYEVDEIRTVLPHEVNSLQIVEGQDYCTLLTCTPYGVNTHRLLVRGHRIPTPEGEDAETFDRIILQQNREHYMKFVGYIAGSVLLLIIIIVIVIIVKRRKKRKARAAEAEAIPKLHL